MQLNTVPSSSDLTPHKHAALITELARQLATGELQAGWWEWQVSSDNAKTWYPCDITPQWGCLEYRCIKTDKYPESTKSKELEAIKNFENLQVGQIFENPTSDFVKVVKILDKTTDTSCYGFIDSGRTEVTFIENWTDLLGFRYKPSIRTL